MCLFAHVGLHGKALVLGGTALWLQQGELLHEALTPATSCPGALAIPAPSQPRLRPLHAGVTAVLCYSTLLFSPRELQISRGDAFHVQGKGCGPGWLQSPAVGTGTCHSTELTQGQDNFVPVVRENSHGCEGFS